MEVDEFRGKRTESLGLNLGEFQKSMGKFRFGFSTT